MGLNHQLDGQDGSKNIVKNLELFKELKQQSIDTFGPSNQAETL